MESPMGEEALPPLPLTGQILFASVQRMRINETELQRNIESLGGKLETFFSHEITCVLTDELYQKNGEDTKPQGGKVMNGQPKRNSIVLKAKSLGIQIMGIDCFLTWLHVHVGIPEKVQPIKKLSKTVPGNNVTKLNGCFMKIDHGEQHCPTYKTYPHPPEFEFEKQYHAINKTDEMKGTFCKTTPAGIYPECTVSYKPTCSSYTKTADISGPKMKTGKGVKNLSSGSSEPKVKVQKAAVRRFCECCSMYYSCLEKHLKGPRHMKFVSNDDNFKQLKLLSKDLVDFAGFQEKQRNGLLLPKSAEIKIEPLEDLDKFVWDPKCAGILDSNNSLSFDIFKEFTNPDCQDKDLETALPLKGNSCRENENSSNHVSSEKGFMKDELDFDAFIPSDILPENDRLFSSGASESEDMSQGIFKLIKAVFEDDPVSNGFEASQEMEYMDHTGFDNFAAVCTKGKQLEVNTFPRIIEDSNDSSIFLKNLCVESWSVKPVSDVKMVFVRCSVVPSIKQAKLDLSEETDTNKWSVKKVEDTKLTISKARIPV